MEQVLWANVFALTSRVDLFPQAVIEAMAMGHAPIISRTVGSSDCVSDGESGYLVDSENTAQIAQTLERIAADPQAHEERGIRARAQAEMLRWSEVGRRYAELYAYLLQERPARAGRRR